MNSKLYKRHRNRIFGTCRTIKISLRSLFIPDIYDLCLAAFISFITFSIWVITSKRYKFDSIFTFWDAPNSLVWIQGNLDESDDLFSIYYDSSAKDIIFPHCGYYLYMYLMYIISFGNFKLTLLNSIIITGILSVYLFRRLLVVYKPVKNILFSCIIFCLVPLHHVMYRAVPTYDTFFFCIIMLALIFSKLGLHILAAACSIYLCFIRFEGVIVPITLLIVSAVRFDVKDLVTYLIAILFDLFFLIFNVPWQSYLIPNQQHSESFISTPYNATLKNIASIATLMKGNSYLISHCVFLLGAGSLVTNAFPLAIFCYLWELFYSCLTNSEPIRFTIPMATISIVCGFDMLWNSKGSRFMLVLMCPAYMFLILFFCPQQYQAYQQSKQIWNAFK